MTKYIIIIVLLNANWLFGQYTSIPDANFEQFLIDEGIDSEQTLDGQILTIDAESVTALTIDNIDNNISDFTGLEDFSNLAFFDAAFTLCSSINFNGNIQLTELNLVFNDNLETIQINSCINLLQLNVVDNKLSTLDVSQNSLLFGFSCAGNELVSLDLTSNAELTFFSCTNNKLEDLDFRNGNNTNITNFHSNQNPSLKCILVDDSKYSATNWPDIDPNSTFVETQAECDALGIEDNSFTSILIYPNPVSTAFQISSHQEIKNVEVLNILGQRLRSYNPSMHGYSVEGLPSGRYIIRVKTDLGVRRLNLLIE